ncbi:MAG: ribonuclease HII, partial [Muribaculaceae bacterium]|nr:ribonuclease HII [Muribaculaceae bacterium]
VILPDDFSHPLLNDSKKLTERQRMMLRPVIEQSAIAWAVASASPEEIDDINILNATFLAMHRALAALTVTPGAILVDGNRFKPFGDIPFTTAVKGDSRFGNIAAASVLAKTYRDDFMMGLHEQFPAYSWNVNKGYPTKAHRVAIAQVGPSPHHRHSFTLL